MRLAIFLGVMLAATVAAAQPAPPPPPQTPQQKQADQLFTDGRELVKKEDYKGACEKFEQAIALDPAAPGVMLNLGLCNEKLGKLKTSLKWYRDAQVAASSANLDDYEEAAKQRTADLVTKVPHVKIALTAAPADAQVRIDGERISPTDYNRFDLDPGHHELEATGTGKRPFKQAFDIKPSQQLPIAITFEEMVTSTVTVDPGRSRRLIAYVMAGVGVAAIATSGFLAKSAQNGYEDSQDERAGTADPNSERGTYETKMNVATGVFIGGLAVIAGGAVLWFTAPKPEEHQESAFAPVIGPDRFGIAYSRGF